MRYKSLGDATGTNPVSGSATWSGAMTGLDHSTHQYGELTNRVRGDATITIDDFSSSKADVAFTNIRDTATGAHHGDMTWSSLPLTDGTFWGDGLVGHFYGPNHEEVGGVFLRNQISGAFGATR